MKSLFGPFNPFLDEMGHLIISIVIVLPFMSLLTPLQSIICILCGLAIDIDHLFNNFICKKILKIEGYKGTLVRGDKGYSPHLFHGIDVVLLVGVLVSVYVSVHFGIVLTLVLLGHLAWDFIIYPNKLSWLLLITRASKRFRVGERNYLRGLIFDEDTLMY